MITVSFMPAALIFGLFALAVGLVIIRMATEDWELFGIACTGCIALVIGVLMCIASTGAFK